MKQLFNNENRIAVILRNIEMQSVCSVESLAAKLDVSQKTIRNDIKELNCLLGGTHVSAITKEYVNCRKKRSAMTLRN